MREFAVVANRAEPHEACLRVQMTELLLRHERRNTRLIYAPRSKANFARSARTPLDTLRTCPGNRHMARASQGVSRRVAKDEKLDRGRRPSLQLE